MPHHRKLSNLFQITSLQNGVKGSKHLGEVSDFSAKKSIISCFPKTPQKGI
jgi:hypothetical protein